MKGILFKPWKIQFIAEQPDMEIMTRRVGGLEEINRNPDDWEIPIRVVNDTKPAKAGDWLFQHKTQLVLCVIARPRYQVGETVYIKEAICRIGEYAIYRSDSQEVKFLQSNNPYKWRWRKPRLSPLHLPSEAARYFIEITDVRAERLQEITEDDAEAEGFCEVPQGDHPNCDFISAKEEFAYFWNSINKDYPWESNPWVWVYTFKLKEGK